MSTEPRTRDGEPLTEHHGHPGLPIDVEDALRKLRHGLPVYWPTDPVWIDQRAAQAFLRSFEDPADGAHA